MTDPATACNRKGLQSVSWKKGRSVGKSLIFFFFSKPMAFMSCVSRSFTCAENLKMIRQKWAQECRKGQSGTSCAYSLKCNLHDRTCRGLEVRKFPTEFEKRHVKNSFPMVVNVRTPTRPSACAGTEIWGSHSDIYSRFRYIRGQGPISVRNAH